MIKILFLIHDLGVGGAEKVLVNLVNNMDKSKFDIHVISLFGGGINEQYLSPEIHYKYLWNKPIRGNSQLMKMCSPQLLHQICIKDKYDIEVAYLESTISRIISGCKGKNTKLYSWIHIEQRDTSRGASLFRSHKEAEKCYQKFSRVVCVSQNVKECFQNNFPNVKEPIVLYNTIEVDMIKRLSEEIVDEKLFRDEEINIVAVGKIAKQKGFDRIARIILRLRNEGFPVHFYALGRGIEQEKIELFLQNNGITKYFSFLGYQTNPYKYMAKCDLFVCASYAEGFSTAATEALILGLPVCTVNVSGMKEMLGNHNEWGIVTENNEEALFDGIKELISDNRLLAHYKERALERGKIFSTRETVEAAERLFLSE